MNARNYKRIIPFEENFLIYMYFFSCVVEMRLQRFVITKKVVAVIQIVEIGKTCNVSTFFALYVVTYCYPIVLTPIQHI